MQEWTVIACDSFHQVWLLPRLTLASRGLMLRQLIRSRAIGGRSRTPKHGLFAAPSLNLRGGRYGRELETTATRSEGAVGARTQPLPPSEIPRHSQQSERVRH